MLSLLFKLLFESFAVLSLAIATSHLSSVCLNTAAKSEADEVDRKKLLPSSEQAEARSPFPGQRSRSLCSWLQLPCLPSRAQISKSCSEC